jgi:hypothetical protein
MFLMRLACGDLLDVTAYLKAIRTFHQLTELTSCDAVNLQFYSYGHRYIYSPSELRRSLESVGYVDIIETRAGRPHHAIFADAEGHGNVIGDEINAEAAFGLEAKKA